MHVGHELLESADGHLAVSASSLAIGGRGRTGRGGLLAALGLLAGLLAARHKSINSLGLLGGGLGSLLGDDLLASALHSLGSWLLLLATAELDNLGVALLELPFADGVGEDTLGDLALSTGERSHVDLLGGGSGANLLVTESLDGGLELIISVEVGGAAGGVEGLLELGAEVVDDEAALNTVVGGEDVVGVDAAELEGPLGDHDDLALQIEHVNLGELALVVGDGGLGEVGWHVEEGVGDEEVGLGLFDEDLQVLSEEILGETIVVSTVLDHLGVKGLESGSGHLFCGFLVFENLLL